MRYGAAKIDLKKNGHGKSLNEWHHFLSCTPLPRGHFLSFFLSHPLPFSSDVLFELSLKEVQTPMEKNKNS